MWNFRHRQLNSIPLRIQFLHIIISKNNSEQVGIVFDRIMAPSDPEVLVDQVGNLSVAKETVFFLGLLFHQTDSLFELGIMDDFVQRWSNPRIEYFKIRHWNATNRWWRCQFIHWINQLHFFDPLHRFRRKLWTSTNLGLESYLPTSKGCWRRELVKMKIRNLQSLLVCPIIRVSSTEDDWIFGWRSRLASQILVLFWSLTFLRCRHVNRFFNSFLPRRVQFLRIRSWRRSLWMCKTFPDKPDASQIFGGPSVRRGDTNEGLNIPSRIGCLRNNKGWLVTWEFPLRTDSASWKSLESFIQFTSFCNSCNLPDNSITVFWSSMSFLLASVSKVELWNFRNSSISVRLCWWTSQKFFCGRHNSSCRIWHSCSARAAWSSWWPIFSQCSVIISVHQARS